MRARAALALMMVAAWACSVQGPPLPTAQVTPVETAASLPSATPSAPPTAIPTVRLTPSPAPYVPLNVVTWADNVLVRGNPGYLFPAMRVLRQGTPLLVVGGSPGGEWLMVQTADGRTGWVFRQLVDAGGADLSKIPVVQPSSVQPVMGTVHDADLSPISGIQFSIVQKTSRGVLRNDAMTDETGTFYAFMPPETSGTWSVSYTAVACASNTMDTACNCRNGICGRPYPQSVVISLPLTDDQKIEFVWR